MTLIGRDDMSRTSTLAIVATVMLATATGAAAATKKQTKVNDAAANSLASAATPSPASYAEPVYFQQAKGCIE
jgi:hypothetical protein